MSKIQELLAAKLATRLEAVLASQLDAVLDRAIDAALDRLLGEPAPSKPTKKTKPTTTATDTTSDTSTNDTSTTARVRVEPTHPANLQEFAAMLARLNLGVSASGKALSDLWANRAVSIAKHYGEEAIPWNRLWAMIQSDPKLPTKGTGSARAIAEALGLR